MTEVSGAAADIQNSLGRLLLMKRVTRRKKRKPLPSRTLSHRHW